MFKIKSLADAATTLSKGNSIVINSDGSWIEKTEKSDGDFLFVDAKKELRVNTGSTIRMEWRNYLRHLERRINGVTYLGKTDY